MALFGPAGLADSFKAMGYKKSIQVADYLAEFAIRFYNTNAAGTFILKDMNYVA